MAYIKLKSVSKTYGGLAVIENLDLDIEEGEFVVFVGPSGCGKSTLLRMIAGLEDVSGGTIELDGQDVTRKEPFERGVAMVFQSYALYPHFSVSDNMGFALRLRNEQRETIRDKVGAVAQSLKLDALLDRKPVALSGGQRQRVAIGRAITRDPKVFLFDEPLSNLDAELRSVMRSEFAHLHRQMGTTMIYVTHDQVEAMTLAHRIVVLRGGTIEQIGTPRELYDRPANKFVAGFIGSPAMNFLSAQSDQGRLRLPGLGRFALHAAGLHANGPVLLGIRPDRLSVGGGGHFTGRVEHTEFLGASSQVHLSLENGDKLLAVQTGAPPYAHGECVGVSFDPDDVFVFGADERRIPMTLTLPDTDPAQGARP